MGGKQAGQRNTEAGGWLSVSHASRRFAEWQGKRPRCYKSFSHDSENIELEVRKGSRRKDCPCDRRFWRYRWRSSEGPRMACTLREPKAITPILARGARQAAKAPEGSAASGKALGENACLSPDDALQRLFSTAAVCNVARWHFADTNRCQLFGRYWGQSGRTQRISR